MAVVDPIDEVSGVPRNSSLAIISLVAGVLGLTLLPIVGGVVALITGYMAKREIQESAGAVTGNEFATIGIVLGWISVALSVLACLCALGVFLFLVPVTRTISFWGGLPF